MLMKPKELLIKLVKYVPLITKPEWDAKECILEMKEKKCPHWKKTEWVGFYLEFITEMMHIPGVAQFKIIEGNTSFNGIAGKNVIDYKTSSSNEGIPLNDMDATNEIVKKYKELVYIIVKGGKKTEKNRELDKWRKKLTGKSKYVLEGEKMGRKHRKLKTKFFPKQILYISINKKNIKNLKIFNQGRNADGSPRKPKYIIPIKMLKDFTKAKLELSQFRKKEGKTKWKRK